MLFTQMLVSTSYRKKTQVTSSTNRKKIKPFFHEIRETMGHRIFIKCTFLFSTYMLYKNVGFVCLHRDFAENTMRKNPGRINPLLLQDTLVKSKFPGLILVFFVAYSIKKMKLCLFFFYWHHSDLPPGGESLCWHILIFVAHCVEELVLDRGYPKSDFQSFRYPESVKSWFQAKLSDAFLRFLIMTNIFQDTKKSQST